jgi:hypothetical protein
MSLIQSIKNLVVAEIKPQLDYIQLFFTDGTILNVYNNHKFNKRDVSALKMIFVKSVEELKDKLIVEFDDHLTLSIGLEGDDYNGPEALALFRPGKPPVILN